MSCRLALLVGFAFVAVSGPDKADAIYAVFASQAGGAVAVQGDALDAAIAGALQVETVDFGIENPLVIDPRDDAIGPGRANFKPLGLSLPLGPGIPALLQTSGAGGHYGDVTLHFRTNGARAIEYATLALKVVTVSSVEISASDDNPPQATVTLAYGSMKLDVVPLDAKGTAGTAETGTWNTMTGTADFSTVPKPK
jgi:type VI protein secretion system component Hcp